MTERYPETLKDLQAELAIHALDGDSTPLMRWVIFSAQIGPLASHLCHDRNLNPGVRPYGSKAEEINSLGHALVQLMTYGHLRGIDIQQAVNVALDNLRTKDFLERGPDSVGSAAVPGSVTARAYVDPTCKKLFSMPPGYILVAIHPNCEIVPYTSRFSGIITEQGGMSCHAAIVARELGIPCVTGRAGSTTEIRTGMLVKIENGTVTILEE